MLIRTEQPSDFPQVAEVIRRAFGGEAEVRLVEELRREPDSIAELSLVAVADDAAGEHVVGHLFFSPLSIDGKPGLALAPLAVLPEFQRTGVGIALTREGMRRAAQLGHTFVVVVGHPAYYPRFGFVPARARGLEVPFAVSDEAFLVCELTPGALCGISGMVQYSPPFNRI